jgi:hypothetical protein
MDTDTLPATESLASTTAAQTEKGKDPGRYFLVQGATTNFRTKRDIVKYINDNEIGIDDVKIVRGVDINVGVKTRTEIVLG